jgi:hypothetical protein
LKHLVLLNILVLLILSGCTGSGGEAVDSFLGLGKKSEVAAPTYAIQYGSSEFHEAATDGGQIDEVLTINLERTGSGPATFSGNINDDFVAMGKILVNGVPAGLTGNIVKQSDTQSQFCQQH